MSFFAQPYRFSGILFSGLILATFAPSVHGKAFFKFGIKGVEIDSVNKNAADEEVNNFLARIANSQLMNMKEGNAAVERGNSPLIRDYGRKMIKDHHNLLIKIRRLAQARTVLLPVNFSEDRKKVLGELEHASGEDFDRKFVALMIGEHDRDIKDFRKAIELKDIDVSDFALKYLPVIQSHLDEIKTIKKSL